MEILDDRKVTLVAIHPRGGPSAWWEKLQNNRRQQSRQPIHYWQSMKQTLISRFLLPDYEQYLFQQYHSCVQDPKSIQEYIEITYQRWKDKKWQDTYMLKREIKQRIDCQILLYLTEAQNMALKSIINC